MKKPSNANKTKAISKIPIKHKIEIRKKDKSSSYDKYKKGTSKLSSVKLNFKRIYSSPKNQKKNISINSPHKNIIIVNKIKKNLSKIINNENSSSEDDFNKKSTNGLTNKNHGLIKLGGESLNSDITTNISFFNGNKSNENNNFIIRVRRENSDDVNNFMNEKNEILNQINHILNQDNLNEKELFDSLKILIDDYPVINKFDKVESSLLSKKNFDIFDECNNDKFLFIVNLYNYISVINLLWEKAEHTPNIFIKYITELDLYFSFIKNGNTSEIDFVLMTPASKNLYNYISTYGKYIFKDHELSNDAKLFVSFSDKYKYDVGYYFEDMNTINLLNSIGENNCKLLPKIIYYIKTKAAEKLIKLKIIKTPKNYKFHDPSKDNKTYSGYNEFDLCLYMKEDKIIKSNENLKFINRVNNKDIELKKGCNYFFEFKNDANDIKKNKIKTEKVFNRFVNALKNIEITEGVKFDLKNVNYMYFCNKDYTSAKSIIKSNKIKKDVIYSNPQVGLNILLKYDNKVKYLSQNIDIINDKLKQQEEETNNKLRQQEEETNNKLRQQEEETNNKLKQQEENYKRYEEETNNKLKQQKEDFKNKLQEQKKQMDEYIINIKKKFELQSNLKEYESYKYVLSKMYIPINIIELIKSKEELKRTDLEGFEEIYNCFVSISKLFIKIKEENNPLFSRINKFIGVKITYPEDQKEWLNIKDEIIKKSKQEYIKEYYEGLLFFLFGKNHKKKVDYDILSTEISEKRNYVKNLIVFISIYEENYGRNIHKLEEKFQLAIVYIAYKLVENEKISNLLRSNKNKIVDVKGNEKEKNKLEKANNRAIRIIMKEIISKFNIDN